MKPNYKKVKENLYWAEDSALPYAEFFRKNIMYHCTRLEFLSEILKHGLIPIRPLSKLIRGDVRGPKKLTNAVFVSKYPFRWMNWTQELPTGSLVPGAMITVYVSGLKMIPDPNGNGDGIDWAVLEPIPEERFIDIVVSSNENPCSFNKINFKNKSVSATEKG